jgi:hypothetical protein
MLRDFSSVIFQKNAAKIAYKMSEIATSNQTIDMQVSFSHCSRRKSNPLNDADQLAMELM